MQLLQRAASSLAQQNPAYSEAVFNSSGSSRYEPDIYHLRSKVGLPATVKVSVAKTPFSFGFLVSLMSVGISSF